MNGAPSAHWIHKLNRYAAWTALVVVILFIITGYGMTKRIIDPDLARLLHGRVLPIPLFIALIVHGAVSARGALRRWKVFEQQRWADVYVVIASVALLILFGWLFWR